LTSANYDVSPDGERFLMIKDDQDSGIAHEVMLALGWADECGGSR
jgi:hypothetical protein